MPFRDIGAAGAAKLLRILRDRDAEIKRTSQVHIHDDRFNQHLGEQHIQLADDMLDIFHILPGGKNQEGITALVGNNFSLAKNLNGVLFAIPEAR